MFSLLKIEYGRGNTPEPTYLPATGSLAVKTGMAMKIDTSTHKLVQATGDCTAEYIALEDKTLPSGGGPILCYRILPGMVFETALSAYDASTVVTGGRLQFGSNALTVTATAASGYKGTTTAADTTYTTAVAMNFGALVEDPLGATASGDKIIVRLA